MSSKKEGGRAILYARCSTKGQDMSVLEQVEWGIKRAGELNLQFDPDIKAVETAIANDEQEAGDVYFDHGVTGTRLNRPGLELFLERAKRDSKLTHVMVWQRNRIARPRQAWQGQKIEYQLRETGKTIVYQGYVDNPDESGRSSLGDELLSHLEFRNAGQESADKASGVLRGLGYNAKRSIWNGGQPPYGFVRRLYNESTENLGEVLPEGTRIEKPGWSVVIVPGDDDESVEKLDVVRDIFAWYVGEGVGLKGIAQKLNAQGIPSPGSGRKRKSEEVSGRWSPGSVRGIIENPAYVSKYAYGRTAEGAFFRFDPDRAGAARLTTRDELHDDDDRGGRKIVNRDYTTWHLRESAVGYEPIVAPEVCDAAIEKLAEAGETRGRGQSKRSVSRDPNLYPFPKVICGDCGREMKGQSSDAGTVFLCSGYSNGKRCSYNTINRDMLVWYAVRRLQGLFDTVSKQRDALSVAIRERLVAQSARKSEGRSKSDKLETDLHQVGRELKDAHREKLSADTETEKQAIQEIIRELQQKARHLETKLKRAKGSNGFSPDQVDAKVEEALAHFGEAHRFVGKLSGSSLTKAFHALGLEPTVLFEHPASGRKKSVVHRVQLNLNPNEQLLAEQGVVGSGESNSSKGNRGERI